VKTDEEVTLFIQLEAMDNSVTHAYNQLLLTK